MYFRLCRAWIVCTAVYFCSDFTFGKTGGVKFNPAVTVLATACHKTHWFVWQVVMGCGLHSLVLHSDGFEITVRINFNQVVVIQQKLPSGFRFDRSVNQPNILFVF